MSKKNKQSIYREIRRLRVEQRKIRNALKDESNSGQLDDFLLNFLKTNEKKLSDLTILL